MVSDRDTGQDLVWDMEIDLDILMTDASDLGLTLADKINTLYETD